MANAYVEFQNYRDAFAVYVPTKGEPDEIYPVIKDVVDNKLTTMYLNLPEEAATQFLYELRKQDVQARITPAKNAVDSFNHRYLIVTASYKNAFWLAYYENNQRVYNNKLHLFPAYLDRSKRPDDKTLKAVKDAVGHIISFSYTAGSRPGQTRIVKVDKVEPHLADVLISGNDLEAALDESARSCYRCYYLSNIDGSIYLVK